MTSGETLLLIVVILAAALIPIMIGLWVVRRMQTRRLNEVMARYPNAHLVEPALFYGQESAGRMQMRGNGVLALLSDRIQFEMLVPRREYSIPLPQITSIENPTGFLGKTNFRPLLKVAYVNDQGQPDAIAWLVSDVSVWNAILTPR